ncbi:hypothetical protein ABEB36_010213 [Hypothenemus hampei]|uniref:Transmembrane protein n=1 Tax=Hypothenemus hampei TaxID=57062 RepID=A0ABD1EJE3_HYPHA
MFYLISILYCKIKLLQLVDYINQINQKFISEKTIDSRHVAEIIKNLVEDRLKIEIYHQNIFHEYQLYGSIYIVIGVGTLGTTSLMGILYYSDLKLAGLTTCIGYIYYTFTIFKISQEYSDTAVLCANAVFSLKWYLWDVKCQKLYLIMLNQYSQKLKVPLFYFVDRDLELFKRCFRTSYVTANFLYTLRQKNNSKQ